MAGNHGDGIKIGTGSFKINVNTNTISGNDGGFGVDIVETGHATNNVITANRIGTDATGLLDLGNTGVGVIVDGATGTTLDDNVIAPNGGAGGLDLINAVNTFIEGNAVGTDGSGVRPLGNNGDGILITSDTLTSTGNRIGGVLPARAQLIISANTGDGIELSGSGTTGNFVQNNFIGTDPNSDTGLGNGAPASTSMTATSNLIGANGSEASFDAAARNIISGNSAEGVRITDPGTSFNVVAGNYIGTDVSGEVPLGNAAAGVSFGLSPSDNQIGTDGLNPDDAGERNIISGNGNTGIHIGDSGTSGNLIAGNYIGLDATGTQTIGNAWSGILLRDGRRRRHHRLGRRRQCDRHAQRHLGEWRRRRQL